MKIGLPLILGATLSFVCVGSSAQTPANGKPAPVKKGVRVKTGKPVQGADKVDAMLSSVFDNMHTVVDMHFHKGEYNHIVNLSRMTVAANPDDMDIYADAGWLLWSMNRDDEAVAMYEQGAKANPSSYYLYDELGHYFFNRKKDWKKAIYYYEQAVSKPDHNPMSLHMLAHSYERDKQLDKALATWARVLKHNDGGPARSNYDRIKRLIEARGGS